MINTIPTIYLEQNTKKLLHFQIYLIVYNKKRLHDLINEIIFFFSISRSLSIML